MDALDPDPAAPAAASANQRPDVAGSLAMSRDGAECLTGDCAPGAVTRMVRSSARLGVISTME
jgi:hypothetical protein